MKPHLIKINGSWFCSTRRNVLLGWRGVGLTPALAYRDWKQFRGGA